MQFTDLILTFLERLGYSEHSTVIMTLTETADDDYAYESSVVLILGKNEERVIGLFMLAEEDDQRSTVAKSEALQAYSKKFDHTVEKYIVSHIGDADVSSDAIEFYKCESDGQTSQIGINSFPSYSEMWLMNTLALNKRKAVCDSKHSGMLATYAYFFALVFLVLAVGDIFVEKMLDTSYLNTQRTLLIIASVLLLFVPGFVKKGCRF